MRRIFAVALLATVAAVAAFAQEFRPIPNPPVTLASDYLIVIHEIDAVLMADGSV